MFKGAALMCMIYPIDFDVDLGWRARFLHATSSYHVPNILNAGFTRPDFARVLRDVIGEYDISKEDFARISCLLDEQILGLGRRSAETFDGSLPTIAAYFLNHTSLSISQAEISRVVPHGGEVYATTFRLVCEYLRSVGREILPAPRHEGAAPVVFVVEASFDLNSKHNSRPSTAFNFTGSLAESMLADDLSSFSGIQEVQFTQNVHAQTIVFQGHHDELRERLAFDLMSPEADDEIQRRLLENAGHR